MGLSPTVVPTASQSGDSPLPPARRGAGDALTSDFETFLRLLTAQLGNQDPLKPMESTEFVSQLASFSAVEQQTRTNTLLEQLVDSLTGQDGPGLADWVGREVGVGGPIRFDGRTPVTARLAPDATATSARLDIYNAFGTLVASQDVAPGATTATWAGTLPDGSTAAAGDYRIEASYFTSGTPVSQATAMLPAVVTEVRLGGDGAALRLRLADGREVAPDEIAAIFGPVDTPQG